MAAALQHSRSDVSGGRPRAFRAQSGDRRRSARRGLSVAASVCANARRATRPALPETFSMKPDTAPAAEEKRLKYSVPALEKGLDILEFLSDQAVPMTQAQLARALSRQPGELFRMLACLEGRGYLHRDPAAGGYSLTLRLFELSRTHSPHEALLRAARPLMRTLADEIRESCHLSVLHRGELVVLAQEESPEPFRLSIEVGSRHSPMRTTSGRVLLAALDDEQRAEVLGRQREWKAMPAADKRAFEARLDAIRETGVDQSVGERFAGSADIGVLVGRPGASITAALTVARLVDAGSNDGLDRVRGPLVQCAAAISHDAGLGAVEIG
ncbi:IclR family transcriptional regulator [Sphingomonas gei]|uniref:IclR family transcriptional regulator n=2 Tax=Sphingomonas gei TaxID=1395960 RepID=A0A4S1XHZ5_9SPHN|nr:IclR family transcriptional regulator [Sphingomonas gei]